MNIYLIISIIEAIYIIYFLRYFKTKKSLDYGRVLNCIYDLFNVKESKLFDHYFNDSDTKISHICPFGHIMALIIGLYLVVRVFLPIDTKNKIRLNLIVLALIFIGSFMNFNAVVYLTPFFIVELMLNFNFKKIEKYL